MPGRPAIAAAPDGPSLARASATLAARYRVQLVDRAADLPGDWSAVRAIDSSLLMDPRFLTTVERAFPLARCYHALVHDERAQPCAWASLCAFPIDLVTLAGPGLRSVFERCRAIRPDFGHLHALLVGLPVSLGQSHLAIAPHANVPAILMALDDVCADIATRERASLIVWKEFDPGADARLEPLWARGYRRAESPAMHELAACFADFESYCGALKSHYRNDVRRSERTFRAAGFRVAHLDDPDVIARVYTPEVHRLYEAVVARAAVKLELLPIEFFRELVRQFPKLVTLTVVSQRSRIVAFNWALLDGRVHRYLFCGMDYAVASDTGLYFGLMYHQLDFALRLGADRIEMGQTADMFKARLGCRSIPRSVYVKGVRTLSRVALWYGFSRLFPRRPPIPVRAVFREVPTTTPRD